jgi:hypothetical protein
LERRSRCPLEAVLGRLSFSKSLILPDLTFTRPACVVQLYHFLAINLQSWRVVFDFNSFRWLNITPEAPNFSAFEVRPNGLAHRPPI